MRQQEHRASNTFDSAKLITPNHFQLFDDLSCMILFMMKGKGKKMDIDHISQTCVPKVPVISFTGP